MTVRTSTLLDAALSYAAQGLKVFPLKPRGKKPITEHGLKDASQLQSTIRKYWTDCPTANIGIRCDGLLVGDFDGLKGKQSLARMEAEHGKLPRTWTIRTGGGTEDDPKEQGVHYVYRVATDLNIRPGAKKYGYDGFDIRANDSYIVAVPSVTRLPYETIDDAPIADAPQWLIELAQTKKSAKTGKPQTHHIEAIKKGARSCDLLSLAGRLRRDNLSEDMVTTLLLAANNKADLPMSESEVIALVKEYEHQANPDKEHRLNDVGNAERLVSLFGDSIRYNYERKLWLIWQGKYWKWDECGEIMLKAQQAARSIYIEAAREEDDDKRETIAKWAHASESNMRLSAMIAQAQPMVSITIDQFDRDEWLLNCNNGTINLKTGKLQLYNPLDLITRVIDTDFDPDAVSDDWVKFLNRAFDNKVELIAFIKRALGYSITGNQGEQAIFFCHGSGWNCKSTLLEAVRIVLGEYSAEVEPEVFMVDKHKGTGPNEAIASLYKINFLCSTEIEDGQKLSTSFLKRMTGGESLRCEHKFERGFSFKPQYKLWLSGNHEPEISDTTNSIWNRLKKIPFLAVIGPSERIKDYGMILARDNGKAILAWLVQGSLEWQEQGLGESPEIKEATQAYRDSQDVLHDFLIECCFEQPSATCFKSELYKCYEKWCDDTGDKYPLGKKTFNARIAEKSFYGSDRGAANKPMWRGLRLLTNDERVTKVTNVTENTQSFLHEDIAEKGRVEMVTKVTKVTTVEAKTPKKIASLDDICPVCGSDELGLLTDGSVGYYCIKCRAEIGNELLKDNGND